MCVTSLRQETHSMSGPGRRGTTDIFCVCALRLPAEGSKPGVAQALPRPTAQEAEIAACRSHCRPGPISALGSDAWLAYSASRRSEL